MKVMATTVMVWWGNGGGDGLALCGNGGGDGLALCGNGLTRSGNVPTLIPSFRRRPVIPTKAGIHGFLPQTSVFPGKVLDSRFRGNDGVRAMAAAGMTVLG